MQEAWLVENAFLQGASFFKMEQVLLEARR